jgi:hypothetical protein
MSAELGLSVYEASLELAWAFWSMPDSLRQKVDSYMRSNIWNIQSSLGNVVDDRSKGVWFVRYSDRMARGATPPWDLYSSEQSQSWRDKFPETLFDEADRKLGGFLLSMFELVGNSVLTLVCGTETNTGTSNAPPDGPNLWVC